MPIGNMLNASTAIEPYGAPSWVVLTAHDDAASSEFYGRLFGWEAASGTEMPGLQFLDGRPVASIMGVADSLQPRWRQYLSVADVASAAVAVTNAGGRIIQAPQEVDEAGCFAIFADPSSAEFAVGQARKFGGAGAMYEPGAFAWSELITDDVDASAAFYGAVFGWTLSAPARSDPVQRRDWLLGGRSIAGLLPRPAAMPKEMPCYWDVMFAVEDTASAVENATTLGASNIMPPIDIPHGRIAVLTDPAGTVFSVIDRRSSSAH